MQVRLRTVDGSDVTNLEVPLELFVAASDALEPADAISEVIAALNAQRSDVPLKLVTAFVSHDYLNAGVGRAFREAWPGVCVVGASATGEFTSTALGYQPDSLAVMGFGGEGLDVVAGCGKGVGVNPASAVADLVRPLEGRRPAFGLLFGASLSVDMTTVLEALADSFDGPPVPIAGGTSADRGDFVATYELFGEDELQDSVVAAWFMGDASVGIGVESGWIPGGRVRTVTRATGNIVYELDGQPALTVFEDAVGIDIENNLGAFPFAMRTGPADHDYVLRAIMGMDRETGAITFAGRVPVDAELRLAEVFTGEILDGSKRSLNQALANFSGKEPKGVVVFSCAARKWVLGTRSAAEIDILTETLEASGHGGLPVAGFFCFGEIAPTRPTEPSSFHNETCVSVVIGQ